MNRIPGILRVRMSVGAGAGMFVETSEVAAPNKFTRHFNNLIIAMQMQTT